jgi:hypothetical protein
MRAAVRRGNIEDRDGCSISQERDKEQFFEHESQVVSRLSRPSKVLLLWRYIWKALHNQGVSKAISRQLRHTWTSSVEEKGPAIEGRWGYTGRKLMNISAVTSVGRLRIGQLLLYYYNQFDRGG